VIRMSVGDLESLRYWKAQEDAPIEDLLSRLKREAPPTPQMEAGKALAKLFENAKPGELSSAEVDGWSFDFSRLDAELPLAPVRELKGEMLFDTPNGQVLLVGVTDGMNGKHLRDQKLTERWDAEKYTESLQWRAYLLMFQAHAFTYDVFVGKYDLGDDRMLTVDWERGEQVACAKWVQVYDYHPVTFYTYPGIEADVTIAVCELAGVIARYLPERVS